MSVELLAPAGDRDCLIAAVQNGADAIYLGGTLFNARAFAKNFDNEELKWAIRYAHLHEVKIFVTLNTLYKDEELNDLFDYVLYLYNLQIDALIVQDIGLFSYLKQVFPDFEIHISTQASIMNSAGANFFEKKGAKRIVLARENTLEEIQKICRNTSLDVEVFVHGALCMCYSGQCLMSSMIGKRSGNRGACAQPCRLNYRLKEDDCLLEDSIPYLLSPKDLMTIEHIGDLIDAGVYSFKIEGRMKRPEYVASVVKAYRKAIDAHLNKKKISLTDEISNMKQMFNRNYTTGYAFHDEFLLDGDYPGNKGIVIGKVLGYNKRKQRVRCLLNDTIHQEDSILFESIDKGRPINKMYIQGQLVNQAKKGDDVEIEFNTPVYDGLIRRILDKNLIKKLKETYQKDSKKINITIKFEAHKNQYPILSVMYKDINIQVTGEMICEKALNHPISQERIIQQLSKLGQTVFHLTSISCDCDNDIILPIKILNEMRRSACEQLEYCIAHQKIHTKPVRYENKFLTTSCTHHTFEVMVSQLSQLKAISNEPITRLYYPYQKDSIAAYELCKNKNIPFVLVMPRICKDTDLKEILNSKVYSLTNYVLVNDYGSYCACHDKEKIIGTGLNIYNSYSASFYDEDKILSLEMSLQQLKSLKVQFDQCIYQVYGKVENMISDYCPISQYYFHKQKKQCNLCKHHNYSLVDRKNATFDLMMDENCRMHLLNCYPLYIRQLNHIPVKGYFLHFTNEDDNTVKKILNNFITNNHQDTPEKITTGYFKD